MDQNVEFECSLLKAVEGIQKCWRETSSSTISNCFAHCGFKTEERATEDEVDPLEDVPLSELAHRLHNKNGTTEEQVRDFLLVSDTDGSCYALVTIPSFKTCARSFLGTMRSPTMTVANLMMNCHHRK